MDQQRILVVEDDGVVRLMLEMQLQHAGYIVVGADNGELAIDLLSYKHFDLLITDLRLPNIDGIQVMAKARAIDPDIAIIILTGAACLPSALAAINHHVHCYMLKPVRSDELVRNVIEALKHRHRITESVSTYHTNQFEPTEMTLGPLHINVERRRVTCNNQLLQLTNSEFALLVYLAQRHGAVASIEDITRDVLRYPSYSLSEARSLIKNRIHHLRQKIKGTDCAQQLIQSVRGSGYCLIDDNLEE